MQRPSREGLPQGMPLIPYISNLISARISHQRRNRLLRGSVLLPKILMEISRQKLQEGRIISRIESRLSILLVRHSLASGYVVKT